MDKDTQISEPSSRPFPAVDSAPVPILQNVVSTVNLVCALDLKKIALHARNSEYNPRRFAAVIMRIKQPKTTALLFSSGKMVCTGAKSVQESKQAARKYARILQKLNFPVYFKDFKIQNMVASSDVTTPISLVRLATSHYQFATYEPELFPGLIYRMRRPKITVLVFPSGKLVMTGAKVREDIDKAFGNIYPVLMSFTKEKKGEESAAIPDNKKPHKLSPKKKELNYKGPFCLTQDGT